jgi:hypothetical protein
LWGVVSVSSHRPLLRSVKHARNRRKAVARAAWAGRGDCRSR